MAFVHELGHNFGAYHASCVNDIPRGSFAWCDFPSTDKRASMCAQTPSYTDYCSPFNVMGAAPKVFGQSSDWRQKRSFGMDAKVVFNWVDPALVTTIDWDPITSSYTTCTPNCSFLLQRSDVTVLNASSSAVIFLQARHPSQGGNRGIRYFVMEHRYDMPLLLLHWTDIDPTGGFPWPPARTGVGPTPRWPSNVRPLGHTMLTDCHPETTTWDDAGCSPGDSIELDTGSALASMKINVSVSALESGLMRVTVTQVSLPLPSPPPPPPNPLPPPPPPPSPSPPPLSPPPSPSLPPPSPPSSLLLWILLPGGVGAAIVVGLYAIYLLYAYAKAKHAYGMARREEGEDRRLTQQGAQMVPALYGSV